ncbi:MAG: 2-C-methyl-D-erythritol 4-phosphate cytidylyltransferase [Spirochaetaceae bacterium]|nr:2-C-methyl-D-erythritol 4-phosphate cytidylyltransferase [Spirochaetaceae bacterium]
MASKTLKAAVVLTAAGSSSRMGIGTKKEFLKINDKYVLQMALESFTALNLFSNYIIVLSQAEIENGRDILSSFSESFSLIFASGGASRQESVYNGLLALEPISPDIVLIHDGARPWTSRSVIEEVYSMAVLKEAAIPVVPSVNAMKTINSKGTVIADLKRDFTVAAQTPQGFSFKKILSAHKKAINDHLVYIDDAAIYGKYIGDVATVSGDIANRKITYISDIKGN